MAASSFWRVAIQRRRFAFTCVGLMIGSVLLSGCSAPTATWNSGGESGGGKGDPIKLAITSPKAEATGVPTSTEIGIKVSGADATKVVLKSEDGQTISGEFRPDGSTWVPSQQLQYDTTYTVTVTATNKGGGKETTSTTFTTMSQPSQLVGAGLYLWDNQEVGIGMPVVVEFTHPVSDKASVEQRLFVTSEPKVEGAWHWFSDTQVHYRPKEYWKPGTKISVRIAIGGLPFGNGWYGKRDRIARDVVVGEDIRVEVDNNTKQLSVIKNGEVIKTMPVSLGKPSSPSSSGKLVIMEKKETAMFDSSTYGVPVNSPDGYRTEVKYAMRLTWGGEFIHAAPWSVSDQGRRNVSHGCVNVSTENARYLFNLLDVGTPVTVMNTEVHVAKGDGWTGWDMSWEDYLAGSALT